MNIAYVAIVVHIYCKRLFLMFHLFFRRILQVCCLDVAYVSHILCKCFLRMLLCVAIVFKCFMCFLQVFQMHVSSVSSVFRRMLQVFVSGCFKNRSGVASPSSPSAVSPWCFLLVLCCLASFSDCGGGAVGPVDGARHGMAARTRVHALPFYYAGR
jgi:hypothetical protein